MDRRGGNHDSTASECRQASPPRPVIFVAVTLNGHPRHRRFDRGPRPRPSTFFASATSPAGALHKTSQQDWGAFPNHLTWGLTIEPLNCHFWRPASSTPHTPPDIPLEFSPEETRPPPLCTDLSAGHVAVVLLLRCVACALDFDLRGPAKIATAPASSAPPLQNALPMTTATLLTKDDMWHACRKADLGGLSIHSADRRGAQAAVHWAALTAVCRPLQDEVQHFNIDLSYASMTTASTILKAINNCRTTHTKLPPTGNTKTLLPVPHQTPRAHGYGQLLASLLPSRAMRVPGTCWPTVWQRVVRHSHNRRPTQRLTPRRHTPFLHPVFHARWHFGAFPLERTAKIQAHNGTNAG